MVNSPKPKFAGAIRNDEADYIFKFFGSYPNQYYRYVNDDVIWTQEKSLKLAFLQKNCLQIPLISQIRTFIKDNVANMWAQFIKESRISDPEPDFEALEYKNGHCLISLDYFEWYKMVCIIIFYLILHDV